MHANSLLARILSTGAVVFLFCSSADGATRVLKLKSQNPVTVCETLHQLFGDRLRAAVVMSINAVVITANSEPALDEASALLAQLDRRPAVFRYQVRRREDRSASKSGFRFRDKAGSIPAYERRSHQGHGTVTRTISGMEGSWLELTDDSMRIVTQRSPWGPESAIVTHRQGVELRGTRGASGTAIIEIRAASGSESQTSTILSRIEAPFGRWFSLGGTGRSGSDAHTEATIGRPPARFESRSAETASLEDWELLVDIIAAGD